jgi:hypothetical protein
MTDIVILSSADPARLDRFRDPVGTRVMADEHVAGGRSATYTWSDETLVIDVVRNGGGAEPSGVRHVDQAAMAASLASVLGGHVSLSGGTVSVATPIVTWRTLWSVVTPELTVLSTSLRLCVRHLGDFEPDEVAVRQFLATGTLGPVRSWDRRIRQVPGAHEVTISNGRYELVARNIPTEQRSMSDSEAMELLRTRISAAVSEAVDEGRWAVPLSGGYDSRALLLFAGPGTRTITWGDAGSLEDPGSDASVAARLAEAMGAPHDFLEIEPAGVDLALVVKRFVRHTEGRVDHIDGYADGFHLWEGLAQRGISGILRGDEALGAWDRRTECGVRRRVGAISASEIKETELASAIGDLGSLWRLQRTPGQTLPSYRDELYRRFRGPAILAPLNQAKSAFVDVQCPLLDDRVMDAVLQLSDHQRTDKRLFRQLVAQISPPVPFATRSALASQRFVDRPDVRAALSALSLHGTSSAVPTSVRVLVSETRSGAPDGASVAVPHSLRKLARRVVPAPVVRRLARRTWDQPLSLNLDQVRLRVVVADEAHAMLSSAALGGRPDQREE